MTNTMSPLGGGGFAGNGLAELPRGDRTFRGVRFRVGDDFIQLSGKPLTSCPVGIGGIPVDRRVAALYVLHGTQKVRGGTASQLENTGSAMRTARRRLFPSSTGKTFRDWWNSDNLPVTRGTLVWTGGNISAESRSAHLRLYLGAWTNPNPEKKVTSLEYLSSAESDSAPFCLAMTVEERGP